MSKLITERNTGSAGEIPRQEYQAKLTKRYGNALKVAQGVDYKAGVGLVPGLSPQGGSFASSPKTYRCDNIRGGLYLRNTSAGLQLNNPTYPSDDSGIEGVDINVLINQAINAGNFMSRVDLSDGHNPADFPGGRVDVIKTTKPDGTPITPAIPAGTIVSIPAAFSYYRGFETSSGFPAFQTDPSYAFYAQILGWFISCRLKSRLISTGDWYTEVWTSRGTVPAVSADDAIDGVSQTEILYTHDPGVYTITEDIYLIGRTTMFSQVTDSGTGHVHIPIAHQEALGVPSVPTVVLGYGPPNHINHVYITTNPPPGHPEFTDRGFTTTPIAVNGTTFYFKSRTIVDGERRVGRATLNTQEQYLGVTRIGHGEDRDTSDANDDAPYVVQSDSAPIWYEVVMQGILFGTNTSEYLLQNEQVKSARQLQRISTVGCPSTDDPLFSPSAMLEGNVYFISNQGLSTLPFSNETQSFLPRHLFFDGYRMTGNATALAASRTERCLYVSFDDGTLWKIRPDLGQVFGVNLSQGNDSLRGVLTRDGDVFAVFSEYDGSGNYVGDYFSRVNQGRVGDSVIETTAFGKQTGIRARIIEAAISMGNIKGGTVEVPGDGRGPRQIQLVPADMASGFSGQKRIVLGSRIAPLGEGQSLRLTFHETQDFVISAIEAKTEVS